MVSGWLVVAAYLAAGAVLGFAAGWAVGYLVVRRRHEWLVEELARARERLEGCRRSLRICIARAARLLRLMEEMGLVKRWSRRLYMVG